jgi:hypothetical protein
VKPFSEVFPTTKLRVIVSPTNQQKDQEQEKLGKQSRNYSESQSQNGIIELLVRVRLQSKVCQLELCVSVDEVDLLLMICSHLCAAVLVVGGLFGGSQ